MFLFVFALFLIQARPNAISDGVSWLLPFLGVVLIFLTSKMWDIVAKTVYSEPRLHALQLLLLMCRKKLVLSRPCSKFVVVVRSVNNNATEGEEEEEGFRVKGGQRKTTKDNELGRKELWPLRVFWCKKTEFCTEGLILLAN